MNSVQLAGHVTVGERAIIAAGFGAKEHSRAAIQSVSGDIPARRVYAHTGWRKLDGVWTYLHGNGALGPHGPLPNIEVHLPDGLHEGDDLFR